MGLEKGGRREFQIAGAAYGRVSRGTMTKIDSTVTNDRRVLELSWKDLVAAAMHGQAATDGISVWRNASRLIAG